MPCLIDGLLMMKKSSCRWVKTAILRWRFLLLGQNRKHLFTFFWGFDEILLGTNVNLIYTVCNHNYKIGVSHAGCLVAAAT